MNNEQAFEQGFRDKCAEYGVSPDALIKAAQGVGVYGPSTSQLSAHNSGYASLGRAPTQDMFQHLPEMGYKGGAPVAKPVAPAATGAASSFLGSPVFGPAMFAATEAVGPAGAALGAMSGANPGNRLQAGKDAWGDASAKTLTGRAAAGLGRMTSSMHPIQAIQNVAKRFGTGAMQIIPRTRPKPVKSRFEPTPYGRA